MHRARAGWLLAAALIAGCGDSSQNGDGAADQARISDFAGAPDQSARVDLAAADQAAIDQAVPDVAMVGDLAAADTAVPPDQSVPLDSAQAIDMAVPVDLEIPSDFGMAMCANTTKSCGPAGMCVDCTNSAAGHACVSDACGCQSATDCPVGTACDPRTSRCGTACIIPDAGVEWVCNGGCCDATLTGSCQPGTSDSACGTGAFCMDCADTCSPGPVCMAGQCGCSSSTDCTNHASCRIGLMHVTCVMNACQ
jgi:hypothetical protein